MTAEQPETPLPPEGFATWLDYVLRPAQSPFLQVSTIAAAELAALRKELAEVDASETKLITERDDLQSLLRDVEITLGGDPNFAEGDGALERSKDAADELAALRQKLSDTEGWLATARQQALDLDAMRAEAVRERDTLKMLREKGCDCSDEEACRFVRERNEAVRDHNAICSELASVVGREVKLTLDLERVAKDRDEACKERDEARTQQALSDRVLSKERDELRSEVDALRVERVFNAQALAALTNELIAARMSLDEARAKLAELREAALNLGELKPTGELWFPDSLRYAVWNALVAKLRAEQGGEAGK